LPINTKFLTLLFAILLLIHQPGSAGAQEISFDFGEGNSLAGRSIQLLVLITLLSLVPGLAIMITCFPFIVTVLSILRQAIGLQQSPPNMLIVSLALFLTYFVMEPVFTEAWRLGVDPLVAGQIEIEKAFIETLKPFRVFMAARIDPETFVSLAELRAGTQSETFLEPTAPLSILVPSFFAKRN